nr:ALBINO3-like protein 1, chloroplastic isoform X4 (ALB4) [Polytomella parva]|mmetsp:Transcript_32128/g.58473  ORF Transcript_32128/g.58473 Transcript_32128/m.58473 type:complete len:432 (-) Transcript_32128:292-1587(-)|eukprot:CAMPEP_0175059522 /NCGR_PEP_ID=MMETSP0052_2-20121109/12480_1 /TAXON_ID=51329 ORGANISM="Polytomella parva, Strain SAG 63-3" /NCGR_SAMPLE_ID=MMETSP0052_2 /ASSEMBLY_ACC=CAM_ASM_000194 /LENGTH=431 /DNA_ID=CAMNT_0016325083 /DNA_START=53 /DNA_END=1348 /DNA_ORIENTATION=-
MLRLSDRQYASHPRQSLLLDQKALVGAPRILSVQRQQSILRLKALVDPTSITSVLNKIEENVGVNASAQLLSENVAVLTETAKSNPESVAQMSRVAAEISKPGVIDTVTIAIEDSIQVLSDMLTAAHVPYSYGFSIIITTCLIKLAMYPLIEQQVRMPLISRHVAPAIAALKARFEKSDPDRFKSSVTQLYKEYGISPGVTLFQNLITLPIFFLLFKALRNAASDGSMDEPFFFIPSLAGPHSNGMTGLQWLLPLANGQPPVGWPTALSYLAVPVALFALTLAVQEEVFTPSDRRSKSKTPANNEMPVAAKNANPTNNVFLKYMSPVLMGWFSLQVSSGLSLYWLTNSAINAAIEAKLKRGPLPKPLDFAKYGIAAETGNGSKVSDKTVTSQTGAKTTEAAAAPEAAAKKKSGSKFRALKAEEASRKLMKK